MKIHVSAEGEIHIQSTIINLRGITPIINGDLLQDWRLHVQAQEPLHLCFNAPRQDDGAFHLEVIQDRNDGYCWLRYWLEDLTDDRVLDSFGIRFEQISNVRAYLCNGYYSWDSTAYVSPEQLAGEDAPSSTLTQGYAMTQLLPHLGSGSVIIGFDRHDRFQQTFAFDSQQIPPALTVQTLWDRQDRSRLTRCEGERLVIFEHAGVEDALREWARIVAEASPVPPRLSARPISGWCSWYNLYAYISEENILEHLNGTAAVVQREKLPMWVFQIDDGFTPEMGDWLEIRPQFPRGMKALLDDVRGAGFTPGLWIAPFMVGNRSKLYREHPDWVVKDRWTSKPLAHMRFYGEFRWHKRSEEYYILDATHPEALNYLRQVFRTWRHEWGCEYFKTDFMHFGSEYGPDRALWHQSGLTRIEIWRRVTEMIREEIGDAVWLGCGCPMWASVGLVDAIRIGGDVGVEWTSAASARSLLQNQSTRSFTNHILWQTDPDCVLLREQYHHLAEHEIRSLAIYAGMAGGLTLTSDALNELGAERLRLWRLLLNPEKSVCSFPLLGQSSLVYDPDSGKMTSLDPALVQVRRPLEQGDTAAVFIFNTGETAIQRTYPLSLLNLPSPRFAYDWTNGHSYLDPIERLEVTVGAHDGVLIFLAGTPFDNTPESLP